MNFSILPNLIALAILVAVFWAIYRKETTEQLHLWLAGWVLVLLHFGAEFLGTDHGPWASRLLIISLDSLVLASVAFLTSVSSIATTWKRQLLVVAAMAVPALAYVNGLLANFTSAPYFYVVAALGALAPFAIFCHYHRRLDWYGTVVVSGIALTAGALIGSVAIAKAYLGTTILLTVLNLATAVLYGRHHARMSAGVMTTVCGFFLWGMVFPVATFMEIYYPNVLVESEVWNIPKYLVAVGMILTLLEHQIERSNYLAYHDELTGLPNRRLLEDRLDQAIVHAHRVGNKVAVLLLDLDHFKEVNDTYGHRVGDMTLQAVVAQLSARLRASDTLARSGGDEFTVVSEVADGVGAAALLAALDSALATPISVQELRVHTGLSIGLALYPDDGIDPDQLHAAADKAMYVAKRAARDPGANGKPRFDQVARAYTSATDARCDAF
jgi:diguanylate cyclase